MKRNAKKLMVPLMALFVLALSSSAFAAGGTATSGGGGVLEFFASLLRAIAGFVGEIGG